MLPEPEPIGGAPVARKALLVTHETLTKFKKQVDDALKALDTSPASNNKVSQQTLARATYGQGFAEADALATAYEQVHDNLKGLSKSLSDQLEALSLAIDCAHKGLTDTDEDQAERLRRLQAQTQQTYVQYQRKHDHHGHQQGSSDLGHGSRGQF
jgi:hypothetical protein